MLITYFHGMLSHCSRSLAGEPQLILAGDKTVAYRERLVLAGIGSCSSESGWKGRNEAASTSTWSSRRVARQAGQSQRARRSRGVGRACGRSGREKESPPACWTGPTNSTAPGTWRRRRTSRRTDRPRRPALLPAIAMPPLLPRR
jgi:hypothetical protein